MEKLDEAGFSFRRAIELKSDHAEAHNNLGVVFKELGELEKAQECYRQAIKLNSDYAEAHGNLAMLLLGNWACPPARIFPKTKGTREVPTHPCIRTHSLFKEGIRKTVVVKLLE